MPIGSLAVGALYTSQNNASLLHTSLSSSAHPPLQIFQHRPCLSVTPYAQTFFHKLPPGPLCESACSSFTCPFHDSALQSKLSQTVASPVLIYNSSPSTMSNRSSRVHEQVIPYTQHRTLSSIQMLHAVFSFHYVNPHIPMCEPNPLSRLAPIPTMITCTYSRPFCNQKPAFCI